MMRFACVEQLEIIGEASNLISLPIKTKYPEIDWLQIIGIEMF